MNMLERAIQIAVTAHEGQLDKGGNPYILHPLWIMSQVQHLGEDYAISAVLHDVVEDSYFTFDYLKGQGFSQEIVDAIICLTHNVGDSYQAYIRKIETNPIAKAVKLKDLEHNINIFRLKSFEKKDFSKLERYHKAYLYLKK